MNTIQRLAAEASFNGQDFHGIGPSSNCCEQHQQQCNQGRDCPARQPQPAEAATEVGAEQQPLIPISTGLTCREAWGLVGILIGPWAAVAGAVAVIRACLGY